MDSLQERCKQIVDLVESIVIGRRQAIELIMKSLLCGGHVLLEDVPGVGKTMLAKTLTHTLGFPFRRIQFTSDMFPSDLTGSNVWQAGAGAFEFVPGPLFAPIVLADELNRANPKTQSALLEAMEERKVTVDGHSYALPDPFLVLATQNPLDYEGTYPLPEAQMDRFMFRVRLGYPSRTAEMQILGQTRERESWQELGAIWEKDKLAAAQKQVRSVYVHGRIRAYIVDLAQATRQDERLELGISPRATVALMRAAQSQAWYEGREYVIPDDVKAMFIHICGHRVIVRWSAEQEAGDLAERILQEIIDNVEVPVFSPATA